MFWTPARIHGFEVESYYKKLRSGGGSSFSWKKFGVLPKVAFFSWTIASRKILTTGNLSKHGISIVDGCCMCNLNGGDSGSFISYCDFSKGCGFVCFACLELSGSCLEW